jgi:tetratricopeptide (TPR) repeat protein
MEEAGKTFQRLLKLTPYEDEKLYAQWLNAEITFTEGRISDALPYYFNIINSRFREKALFQIGKGYFLENKFREAMTNLDILFLEFPNSKYFEEGLFLKGEGWVALGNPDHALEVFDLLLHRKKGAPWQLLGSLEMGTLHLARNEEDLAEKVFRGIVERFSPQPLSDQALYQLGNISFRRKNVAEALHYYGLVLKGKAPGLLAEVYFRLGESFYQDGKYDKAFTSFENALRHLSENSLWFFLAQLEMGNLQRRWGSPEEARKSYQILLDRSNDPALMKAARELLSHVESR